MNVFEFNLKNKPKYIVKTLKKDEKKINLLLYWNHFLYITRLDVLNDQKYVCEKCAHSFRDLRDLKRHHNSQVCTHGRIDKFPKFSFPFETKRNTITTLNEKFGTDCDIFFEPAIVYDVEAMVVPEINQITENFKLTNRQQAISVSICTNIPGFTFPKNIIHCGVKELFRLMFEYLTDACDIAVEMMEEKFQSLIDKIESIRDD